MRAPSLSALLSLKLLQNLLLPFSAEARKCLQDKGWSGAFLGGNYVVGVALGRCVEGAQETADEVAAWLGKDAAVAR